MLGTDLFRSATWMVLLLPLKIEGRPCVIDPRLWWSCYLGNGHWFWEDILRKKYRCPSPLKSGPASPPNMRYMPGAPFSSTYHSLHGIVVLYCLLHIPLYLYGLTLSGSIHILPPTSNPRQCSTLIPYLHNSLILDKTLIMAMVIDSEAIFHLHCLAILFDLATNHFLFFSSA